MVSLWITIGLIVATLCVSTLGATFSVMGLGALFSGALLAVWAMAASLELAKFMLAAYVHQRWVQLNLIYKSYLVFAIVVLSIITSMGIFGFLSDAYQSTTTLIDAENVKLVTQQSLENNNKAEIARLNKAIEEIPVTRISKRLKARAEMEPTILAITKQNELIEQEIGRSQLRMIEIKKKVGPLIYIARAFGMEIDSVVKYLTLILVTVFDPLAICLIIAMSQALDSRKRKQTDSVVTTVVAATASTPSMVNPEPVTPAPSEPATDIASYQDDVIQMRFADETNDKKVI